MGCTTSRTEIQLGNVRPWEYTENGVAKSLNLGELNDLRKKFWEKKQHGDPKVWDVLKKCCEAVLEGDIDKANQLLNDNMITVISGELDSVVTEDGTSYNIEKYCYSNPSNMMKAEGQNSESEEAQKAILNNNRFRFRISTGFLNEEREVLFVFDGQDKVEKDHPEGHIPENHTFYGTYHFSDPLQQITDAEVKDKVVQIIKSFPEVVEQHIIISHVRVFYLGRELSRMTPFINNSIPPESIIVVLVQNA